MSSKKVRAIGQGVDTDLFRLQEIREPHCDIVVVGRISPRKRTDRLIEVMGVLHRRWASIPFRLLLIGAPLNRSDMIFDQMLRERVRQLKLEDRVVFAGSVRHTDVPMYYRGAFVHLSLSDTGSMDKALMEALACGCPVLTKNDGLRGVLTEHPELLLQDEDPVAIASQVVRVWEKRGQVDRAALRALVEARHDLRGYIVRVVSNLRQVADRARGH